MNGQSIFIAAGFVPSWKFMTLLLTWHSFVAEVVQLQACFGENYDNIHFYLEVFCGGISPLPYSLKVYMKNGCRGQVTYMSFVKVLPSLIYKAIQLALLSNTRYNYFLCFFPSRVIKINLLKTFFTGACVGELLCPQTSKLP